MAHSYRKKGVVVFFLLCWLGVTFLFSQDAFTQQYRVSPTQIGGSDTESRYQGVEGTLLSNLDSSSRTLLATSHPEYPVTPGDQYVLSFTQSLRQEEVIIVVENDYSINLTVFGTINARGSTFSELQARIIRIVENAYPGSLPRMYIRSTGIFKVLLKGEVTKANEVNAWGLSRLEDLVGTNLTPYSSRRRVEVVDFRGNSAYYDLFLASRFGRQDQNPYIRPGDTIIVHERGREVTVQGQVKRPGSYQLLPTDNLRQVIETYANGFSPHADLDTIQITRTVGDDGGTSVMTVTEFQFSNRTVTVKDQDTIYIPSILETVSRIYLEGAVLPDHLKQASEQSQGEPILPTQSQKIDYPFHEGKMLKRFILEHKNDIAPNGDMTRAFIKREGVTDAIEVDLVALMYSDDSKLDMELRAGDRIVIPFGQFEVYITGEVTRSVWLPVESLTRLSTAVDNYLTEFSSMRDITVISKEGQKEVYDLFLAERFGRKDQDPYLKMGDTIEIATFDRQVTIQGEVKRPGTYQLLTGEELSKLIDWYADGYTQYAEQDGIQITRNIGEEQDAEVFYVDGRDLADVSVRLLDRDRIVVPNRLEALPRVFMEGAVQPEHMGNRIPSTSEKIAYPYYEGKMLRRFILEHKNDIAPNGDMTRAFIKRQGQTESIEVDLEALLYSENSKLDMELQPGDRIVIPFGQFEVYITGEVTRSVWLPVESLTRLSTAVDNYLTEFSSIRDITVTSKEGKKETYDLFLARRFGEKEHDPYLNPGDTIEVSQLDRQVTIQGEVKRPGTYQLLTGEELKRLITWYADGYTQYAQPENIQITRNTGEGEGVEVFYIDTREADGMAFELLDEDRILIPNRLETLPRVFLEGAVGGGSGKLTYPFYKGKMLKRFILEHQNDISPKGDMTRAFIKREGVPESIEVDLEALLYEENSGLDRELKAGDRIVIPFGQFEVYIKGEVKQAVWISAESLTRLSSAVEKYTTEHSSIRDIEVISKDGQKQVYDLFLAERFGRKDQDPYLKPGDTVIVKEVDRVVRVSGQVKRPGRYQLLEEDTLDELITYYGNGLTEVANPAGMEIRRFTETGEEVAQTLYLDYSVKNDHGGFSLNHLDDVLVPTKLSLLPLVFFEGAVGQMQEGEQLEASNRIKYRFEPGEKLSSAVEDLENQFSPVSDLEHAYLQRTGENEVIPVNLRTLLYEKNIAGKDLELKHLDTIVVPFRQFFVIVSGAVYLPGRYPYIPDKTWRYYVDLAGGIDESRNDFDAVEIRDINGNRMRKNQTITPESTVYVMENSFLYQFSQIAPVVTTALSITSLVITILNAVLDLSIDNPSQ